MLPFFLLLTTSYLRRRRTVPDPLRVVETRHRAWPWTCDQNLHVNNAQYLSFLELGRVAWFAETGVGPLTIEDGVVFLVGGATMTYRREIPLGQPFRVRTRLVHAEPRWVVWSQDVLLADGRPAARGLVRAAVKRGHEAVDLREVLAANGSPLPDLPVTPELEHLVEGAREALAALDGA